MAEGLSFARTLKAKKRPIRAGAVTRISIFAPTRSLAGTFLPRLVGLNALARSTELVDFTAKVRRLNGQPFPVQVTVIDAPSGAEVTFSDFTRVELVLGFQLTLTRPAIVPITGAGVTVGVADGVGVTTGPATFSATLAGALDTPAAVTP